MAPRAASLLPAARARARRLLDALARIHPEADCELDYRTPFQLLVATILSAQCTDARVNAVTPELFRRYRDARALAAADPAELEERIRPTGFYRAKARSLLKCSAALVERHGGRVPRTLDELVKLPGVGRKTASVVLGHAYGIAEGIAVDTHVLRVANRLGLVASSDPLKVEQALMEQVPRGRWTQTTDLLIFHGRRICHSQRPNCGACPLLPRCAWPGRHERARAATPARPRKSRRSNR